MATLEEIDRAIASPKTLVGRPVWKNNPSRPERSELAIPLQTREESGPILELRGHATLTALKQRGGLTIIVDGEPVQRVNIFPDTPHSNPFRNEVPVALRGLRHPAGQTRLYLWEHGRYQPARAEVASLAVPHPPDFDAAVRHFLATSLIIGDIPSPPYTPRLFP